MSSKPKPHEAHEPSPPPTLQDVLVAIGELHHRMDQMFGRLKILDRLNDGQDDLIKAVETVQQTLDGEEYVDVND